MPLPRFSLSAVAALGALAACGQSPGPGMNEADAAALSGEAAPIAYDCGPLPVTLTPDGDRARLAVGSQRFAMVREESTSGVKYVAAGDADTWIWMDGANAALSLQGRRLPECVMSAGPPAAATSDDAAPEEAAELQPEFQPSERGAIALPLTARGNEPGWRVEASAAGMSALLDYGETEFATGAPQRRDTVDGAVFAAPERAFALRVIDTICNDSATGTPHPFHAEAEYEGRVYQGCAGEPASLLTGAEWRVVSIAGEPVPEGAQASLRFTEDGRVSGRAVCNQLSGPYTLTPEALSFGALATTRRACMGEGVMQAEQAMLDALRRTGRFDVGGQGELTLLGEGETLLTAVR